MLEDLRYLRYRRYLDPVSERQDSDGGNADIGSAPITVVLLGSDTGHCVSSMAVYTGSKLVSR